jgi:hypothetical protein
MAAAAVVLIHAGTLWAADPTVQECASLNERSGPLRREGKLREARADLLRCSAPSCPAVIRDDCIKGATQLDAAIPTVVLVAQDAAGRDLSAVHVTLDGQVLAEKLDGKALAVDAGDHVVRFEAEGSPPVEQKVILREGEKNRTLRAVIGASARSAATPATTETRKTAGHAPAVAYVLAGLGIVALGVAGYFEYASLHDHDFLAGSCAPTHSCQQSQVDSALLERYVSISALGVGVVSLGVAAWLFLRVPASTPSAAALEVRPLPGGGLASARVAF